MGHSSNHCWATSLNSKIVEEGSQKGKLNQSLLGKAEIDVRMNKYQSHRTDRTEVGVGELRPQTWAEMFKEQVRKVLVCH